MCMMLSSWTTTSIEEVASACGHQGLRWFQLYVYKNRNLTASLIHRAEKAGYRALVITVDTPILGRRLADARNKFNLPPHLTLANFKDTDSADSQAATSLVVKSHDSGLHQYTKELIDPSLNWEMIDWACKETCLPVILKGILTREDAKEALRHGVKGIVVSNHGARQLDGVPATVSHTTHSSIKQHINRPIQWNITIIGTQHWHWEVPMYNHLVMKQVMNLVIHTNHLHEPLSQVALFMTAD